jgi:hypothetical protein
MTRRFIRARETPYGNSPRMKQLLERSFKIPFVARNAAKQIQAKRTVLWKGVAGDVGFGEEAKTGDATGPRELMPLRSANWPQLHAANHAMEESFHRAEITQRIR